MQISTALLRRVLPLAPSAAVLFALPTACTNAPPGNVPRIEAYGDAGRGPTRAELESLATQTRDGLVVRYAAGDRIVVALNVTGDVLRSETPGEATLTVLQPIELWFGPAGIMARVDGGAWRPLRDAIDGGFAVSTGFSDREAINRATIEVVANPAP